MSIVLYTGWIGDKKYIMLLKKEYFWNLYIIIAQYHLDIEVKES